MGHSVLANSEPLLQFHLIVTRLWFVPVSLKRFNHASSYTFLQLFMYIDSCISICVALREKGDKYEKPLPVKAKA